MPSISYSTGNVSQKAINVETTWQTTAWDLVSYSGSTHRVLQNVTDNPGYYTQMTITTVAISVSVSVIAVVFTGTVVIIIKKYKNNRFRNISPEMVELDTYPFTTGINTGIANV